MTATEKNTGAKQAGRYEGAGDVSAALAAVTPAMSIGEIAPEEASIIVTVIEAKRRAIETVELEARVRALEQAPT